jgi:hypothetical protein
MNFESKKLSSFINFCSLSVFYAIDCILVTKLASQVKWGLFFMGLNTIQVIRLLSDRKGVVFDEDTAVAYTAFHQVQNFL